MTAKTGLGIEALLLPKRSQILEIAVNHGASNVRVFGSVARDEATAESDVDFLVEFEPERNLLDRIGLIQDLSDLLDRRVDVARMENLRESMRDRILKDAKPL
ncbi:MAG: nucleotidyltransferase family protein [Cyanobacteria bacterium J06555_13]